MLLIRTLSPAMKHADNSDLDQPEAWQEDVDSTGLRCIDGG